MASIYDSFSIQRVLTKGPLTLNADETQDADADVTTASHQDELKKT